MYLGERITERGVGNGISLLIMIGIIATFPQAIIQEFNHPNTNFFFFLVEIAALLVVIGLVCGIGASCTQGASRDDSVAGQSWFVHASGCCCPQLHSIEGELQWCDAHHLCAGHHVRSAVPHAE